MTYGTTYNFYQSPSDRSVICTTYYKGQIIKGIAKCDPADTFDLERGKELAYLRCRKKLLKRKVDRAVDVYSQTVEAVCTANKRRQRAIEFFNDASNEYKEITQALEELETELK